MIASVAPTIPVVSHNSEKVFLATHKLLLSSLRYTVSDIVHTDHSTRQFHVLRSTGQIAKTHQFSLS